MAARKVRKKPGRHALGRLDFRLPREDLEELDRVARENGWSRSKTIRILLERALDEKDAAEAAEAAKKKKRG